MSKIVMIKDSFTAKNNTYYVVRYALVDDKNVVLKKGEVVIWLTKEQYDSYNI